MAIADNTLRILGADKLNSVFHQMSVKLQYTPRRFLLDQESNNFLIIESEYKTFCASDKAKLIEEKNNQMQDTEEGALNDDLDPDHFGLPIASAGKWASCLRILSPFSGDTLDLLEFDNNEAAISMTKAVFQTHPNENFLIVGSVKDMHLLPKSNGGGFISIFRIKDSKFELFQKVLLFNKD